MPQETEIRVQIRFAGAGFPSEEELDLRHTLEDMIEDRGIGEVVDAGAGLGVVDLAVAVSEPKKALSQISSLVAELGIQERTICRIVRPEKAPQLAVPYQPGDCLSIQLEDGDFGAALVLVRRNDRSAGVRTLVGVLDYKANTPPNGAIFGQRRWLVLNHHSWRNERQVYWCLAFDYAAAAPRLTVVGHVDILPSDPTESRTAGGWAPIGTQTVAQARWDTGARG